MENLLAKSCSNTADKVIDKEMLHPKSWFNEATKHPQGKHVEEQVRKIRMQEHVSEELVNLEIVGKEEVEPEGGN